MAESLAQHCTPLKKAYDSCFNRWFEDYMSVVAQHRRKAQPEAVKAKGEELQSQCGSAFTTYRACIQGELDDRGVSQLLDEARQEDPLSVPPPFDRAR